MISTGIGYDQHNVTLGLDLGLDLGLGLFMGLELGFGIGRDTVGTLPESRSVTWLGLGQGLAESHLQLCGVSQLGLGLGLRLELGSGLEEVFVLGLVLGLSLPASHLETIRQSASPRNPCKSGSG